MNYQPLEYIKFSLWDLTSSFITSILLIIINVPIKSVNGSFSVLNSLAEVKKFKIEARGIISDTLQEKEINVWPVLKDILLQLSWNLSMIHTIWKPECIYNKCSMDSVLKDWSHHMYIFWRTKEHHYDQCHHLSLNIC